MPKLAAKLDGPAGFAVVEASAGLSDWFWAVSPVADSEGGLLVCTVSGALLLAG